MERLTHISLLGEEHTSSCGYCKKAGDDGAMSKSRTSVSFGVSCPERLSCVDYQDLCDRGWRRSGDYLYTLSNEKTCCPALTIRLDTRQFQANKEQRKLVRRLNQYLRGEIAQVQGGGGEGASGAAGGGGGGQPASGEAAPPAAAALGDPIPGFLDSVLRRAAARAFPGVAVGDACLVSSVPSNAACRAGEEGGVGASYCSALCLGLRAAVAKQARPGAPLLAALDVATATLAAAERIEGLVLKPMPSGHINAFLPQGRLCIEGKECFPPQQQTAERGPKASGNRSSSSSSSSTPPPFPSHAWEVKVVPAEADKETFDLYCRYQIAVHKDPPSKLTMEQFRDFLCTSPLIREPWGGPNVERKAGPASASADAPTGHFARLSQAVAQAWQEGTGAGRGLPLVGYPLQDAQESGATPLSWLQGFPRERDYVFPDLLGASSASVLSQGYGTFHHRYYLDGVLIAVGVVDVLPHALSSVYVFYEPSLAPTLPLGKLTALREVQWCQAASRCPCPAPATIFTAPSSASGGGGGGGAYLSAASPRLCYYYLGYYIHSCPKMRYKAEYAPSELLCPVTKAAWVPHAAALPLLEATKCPCLAPAEVSYAWGEQARAREAALGLALSRAVLSVRQGGGALLALTLRDLKDGGFKAHITKLLREEWLFRAGAGARDRCVIDLG
jgi:arginyl-tRNA--protein-N-Asp/Glu arginylyltransferase